MHKVMIIACCAVSMSLSSARHTNVSQELDQNVPLTMNKTIVKSIFEKKSPKKLNRLDGNGTRNFTTQNNKNGTDTNFEKMKKSDKDFHRNQNFKDKEQKTFPILHKIHERITRSKDAVWATITLTFMCVLLVLAVAQSRMWKDNYYSEAAQGVPLPNFNERVLFKDVMEHKISSLKKFFKKKSKENETELESLLPPSEWES